MNAYQINGIDRAQRSQFVSLLLGAMFSADFNLVKSVQSVNLVSDKLDMYIAPTATFQLPFSLSNYGAIKPTQGNTLTTLENPAAALQNGVFQLLVDSRLTNTKELSFRPYPVKGLKVAMLIGYEQLALMPNYLADMESDTISFQINDSEKQFPMTVLIGTVNSSQTETYKPFETATVANQVFQIVYFSDKEVIKLSQNNCNSNVKPFFPTEIDNLSRKKM